MSEEFVPDVCLAGTWCLCCTMLFYGPHAYDRLHSQATEPKTKAQKANHALANGTHKAASKGDKASVKTKTKKATQKKITTAAATVKKTTAVTAKKATPKAVSSKHEGSPGGYFHGQ